MKLTKMTSMLGLVAVATAASSLTFAENYDYDAGWYLGGNIGQSRSHINNGRIADSVLDDGFIVRSITDDDRDTGYKLFGGYQFNKNFALEGGYFNLGEFTFSADTIPLGTLDGTIKLRGYNLDAVGLLPINEKLSAFGRLGITYAETKDSFNGSGAVILNDGSHSDRNTNAKIGLGLQYALNEHVDLRLEAERYRLDNSFGSKDNIDFISVGAVYRFGKKTHPAPAPKVIEPVRQPVAVEPPPPAPKFKKYTLSATELFAFNSDKVKIPQPKLVEIADALKESDSPKNIVIVGYTDNLGSDEYNKKLSERRAIAVKNYIASNGVDADRLKIEGKGEADPVVTCTNKKKAELIECLAPNRRVEIDQITVKVPVEK